MSLFDSIRGVFQTFQSNRVRAFLTLLGVMIGAGSIVMLASLLKSAETALVSLNQGVNEADTFRVRSDEVPQNQREKATRPLSREDGRALETSPQLPGVDVVVEAIRESTAHFAGREKPVRVMGVEPSARTMYRLSVERGRFLMDDDLTRGRRVIVIGHEVYTGLLKSDPAAIGRQLDVDGTSWTVVGVLAHKPVSGHGTGTWMWDRRVLVPRVAFDAAYSPNHAAQSIFVRAGRGKNTKNARSARSLKHWMNTLSMAAEGVLLRRHLGVKNFRIDEKKGEGQERSILLIVQILLLGTGLLSLFVGGMNIMNIMLVTVTERTHEIGLRRAVGATPRSIMRLFLLESVTVSMVGGIGGVVGGLLASWLIGLLLDHALGQWSFVVVPWSIGVGLTLAVATGAIFGLFPAYRAAQLSPVEALRAD